jgi:2Fe-2S ferredoxin
MQGAMDNSVQGIIAECRGGCSCATCHVYVDPAWIDKLRQRSDLEVDMLDAACDLQPNSRLPCQIGVSEALDGLMRMPAKQV